MICSDVQDRLSAYYDSELAEDIREVIALHLTECAECAFELSKFESVSRVLNQSPIPSVPPTIWNALATELDTDKIDPVSDDKDKAIRPFQVQTQRRSWAMFVRLALLTSVFLILGSAVWLMNHSLHDENTHQADFVIAMDQYLQKLPSDPDGANSFLLNKYNGRTVEVDRADSLVGYRPVVAEGLPKGYSLSSTSVLKMPCCTCVKVVCTRQDGSTLVLFEHDDEKTQWFGDRSTNMAMCGDKECCLVQLDSSIAATWKRGSRSLTAVGLRDVDEVNVLVSWFENKTKETL